MAVTFGERKFISFIMFKPGNVIQFNYNGENRYCIVITPEWKGNCDCYVFDDLDDISEELLKYINQRNKVFSGELWDEFKNQYMFKSFKLRNMLSTYLIEYVIWDKISE